MRYALIAYAASWAISLGLRLVLHLALHPARPIGAIAWDFAWVATLIPLWRTGGIALADLGVRPLPSGRFVALVLFALVGGDLVYATWDQALSIHHVSNPFAGIGHHSDGAVILTGITAAVTPVTESMFFGGFIYRALRNRLSIAPASVLVAVMFGLIHTNYQLGVRPELAFGGFILCLSTSTAAHCCREWRCSCSPTSPDSRKGYVGTHRP